MTTTDDHKDGDIPELTFRDRFVAWWEGYDLSAWKRRRRSGEDDGDDRPAMPPSTAPHSNPNGTNRWGRPLWSATRIEVSEKLWGPGFTTPGGSDHVPYLVLPLGLNPAMTVLELGAGLGGITRTMAGKFGSWVTGLEGTPLLANEAMERSVKAGLSKQASIEPYDPENFSFNRRVDAIVFKEGLYTVRNKDQLFDGLEIVLKPRGQVLMTDYVVQNRNALKGLAGWAEKEPLEPTVWTVDEMANAFAQRNLDLRVSEDLTDKHRSLILAALQGLRAHLEQHAMDVETKANVMDEVQLWANRVAALDQGLRVYRFYALKPADGG
jgi:cyclopropane fatty-acyl-phospholipid synthase-like methyltransferase